MHKSDSRPDAVHALPLKHELQRLYVVSVAQFHSKKVHGLQLEAFSLAHCNARRPGCKKCASPTTPQRHFFSLSLLLPDQNIWERCFG